jgi:dTDP-4-dehydrorhamnose reductase
MHRILVLGGGGMLGHRAFRIFASAPETEAYATLRNGDKRRFFPAALQDHLVVGVDADDPDGLAACLDRLRPDTVVNCIGLVKQRPDGDDPLALLPANAMLPHRLARQCGRLGARLVHVSTDCVFRGDRGPYREEDRPDAEDFYGRSKLLGEVDAPHAITLRTSLIGRELASRRGLLEWFLGATDRVQGYTRTIFSGLTTDEFARVVLRHVIPRPELRGVWHVSAAPIAKHDLLLLLRDAYGRDIGIEPAPGPAIDRSLDSTRFRQATGYTPPPWPAMIRAMRNEEDFG